MDHRQWEVISWILLDGLFYAALPLFWLNRVGFRFKNLFYPWPWRRNLWIIAAYWARDFFGPIIGGVDFSLSAKQNLLWAFPQVLSQIPLRQGCPSCYRCMSYSPHD